MVETKQSRGYIKHSEGQLWTLEVEGVMNEVKPGETPGLLKAQQHPARCSPYDTLIQQLLKPAPTTIPHDKFQFFSVARSPQEHNAESGRVFWGKDFFFSLFSPLKIAFGH